MSSVYKLMLKWYCALSLLLTFYQPCFSQCSIAAVNQVSSQVLCNGSTTSAINFSGNATRYTWTNNKPSIGLAVSGTGNIPSFTAVNNGNSPITATVTVTPVQDALAYIVNNGSNSVSVINTFYNSIVATIPVGAGPIGICVSPDNRKVFVTNTNSNSVSVISTITNQVVATIPVGTGPQGVAITPDGNYVYVTNTNSNNVSKISTASNSVVWTIPVGASPVGIAISPDGSKILVANNGSNTVSVINYYLSSVSATIGVGAGPVGIAIMPYGDQVYVTNQDGNTVSRILLPNNAVVQTISGFSSPTGVVATNARIYVANATGNSVSVIDYYTETIIATVGVGNSPISVDLVPGGNTAYVTNIFGNSVSVLNLSNNTLAGTISAATNPTSFGRFITAGCSGNPITFKITVHPTPTLNPIANKSVCGGNTQPEISFSGTATTYSWVNSNPSIGLAASGTGNIPAFTAMNNGNTPITANITVTPIKQPLAYFASNNNVVVVNTATNTTVDTIPVGNNPKGIAVSPDGSRVYVTTVDNGKLAVINTVTNTVDTSITIGNNPSGVVISPDGSKVYVAFSPYGVAYNGAIKVLNTATNAVIATVNTTGKDPRGMTVSWSGYYVYISLFGSSKIDILNTSSNTISYSVTTFTGPYSSALKPDGSMLYVACATANRVWMMSTSTLVSPGGIPVGTQPQALCFNPDGSRLYVTNSGSNNASIISTSTSSVISTINGLSSPFGIASTADGTKVYMCNTGNSTVSVFNPATNIVSTIPFAAGVPSFGNFVHQINNCPGPPVQFSITVNSPASAALATVSNAITLPVTQKTYFSNACTDNLICALTPSGANPVNAITTTIIWLDNNQSPQFVKRHFQITPGGNSSTVTGSITLYFLQSEFDAFNAVNSVKLPTGPADASGIANLLVEKRGGGSLDYSGMPGTYTGAVTTINPTDANIFWNATYSRWEVTFDVTGFSGFWVKTMAGALPLQWLSLTGNVSATGHAELNWKVAETNVKDYAVERSEDLRTYTTIGNIAGKGDGTHDYIFTDAQPLNGTSFYRIKQTDLDGKYTYSSIVKLSNNNAAQVSIYPNPSTDKISITTGKKLQNKVAKLVNIEGRELASIPINGTYVSVNIGQYAPGVYLIQFADGSVAKVVKQ